MSPLLAAVLIALSSGSCGKSGSTRTSPPLDDDGKKNPANTAPTLQSDEVKAIMRHAVHALKDRDYGRTIDAAIAVTDRRGVVLGVATTFDLDYAGTCAVGECPSPSFPAFTPDPGMSIQINGEHDCKFPSGRVDPATDCTVVDLALQLARTASFFSADQTPLTSRSIRFLGGEHFPDGVKNTASAALFGIENTNRGCSFDAVRMPAEDRIPRARSLPAVMRDRDPEVGEPLRCQSSNDPMDKCGCTTGIATLPGGVPIFKNGRMVGGIGVALRGLVIGPDPVAACDAPNQILRRTARNDDYEIGEFAARAFSGNGGFPALKAQDLDNVCAPESVIERPACCAAGCNFSILPGMGKPLPFDPVIFIDGIEIPEVARDPNVGPLADPLQITDIANFIVNPGDIELNDPTRSARPVATQWLVDPTDATDGDRVPDRLTAAEVNDIITTGVAEALKIRGGIRLPLEARTAMMLAVSDTNGVLLGLFRMDDATVFSIDVAVAKSRNVVYFSNPGIAAIDTADCPGATEAACIDVGIIPAGTAITNRTLSFAAQPFFPSGIDGRPPGPYRRSFVEDSDNPCTNGREPANGRQNGIVFFPGSTPLYKNGALVGGFGVSGDGVEQDDIVTVAGATKGQRNYFPDPDIRADQVFVRGVRLPYVKFNRAPDQ